MTTVPTILDEIRPYFRYIALLSVVVVYGFFLLFVYKKIFNDPNLKAWFIKSLTDERTNGASGKSMMALMFSKIIALAAVVSFIWSPDHLMPEYYFITLVGLVAAIYGIKIAANRFNSSVSNSNVKNVTDSENNNTDTNSDVIVTNNLNNDDKKDNIQ